VVKTENTHQIIIRPLDLTPEEDPGRFRLEPLPPGLLPAYLAWGGEDTLWFSTLRLQAGMLQAEGGIWRIDLGQPTPTMESFPDFAGVAFPSPDGRWLAILQTGVYEQTPARLTFYTPDDLSQALASFEFPEVSSASHLPWIPDARWFGDELRFSLPQADAVYSDRPKADLLGFSLDGGRVAYGQIESPFPAEVIWSNEGDQVAYLSLPDDQNQQALLTRNLLTGAEETIAPGLEIGARPLLWHNDLLYLSADQSLIGLQSGELESVWGLAPTLEGEPLILQGSPSGQIRQGGEVLIDSLPTFAVSMVPGLEPQE
jgi:hypothetical protein